MIKHIYIHIPFCKNICNYCDFCKVYYNKNWVNDYLNSLDNEIKNNYKGEIVDTIYIGGGTPSSLNINELNRLFNILNGIKLSKNYEFTIECNVEDITEEKLKMFKMNKVNRLSIGVESFNDKYLKYLGRNYDSSIITDKINLSKKYFDNINIDLIYALKDETINDLENELNNFIRLDIPHISIYSLILEDNTKLKVLNEKEINSDLDRDMYELIVNKLSKNYNHYEISNFSKEGYESKHNLSYWNNDNYYGFGLGASGYVDNIRYTNTRNLSKYISNYYDRQEEILNNEDIIKYELILGFRKINGINIKDFYNKYNLDIISLYNIKELIDKGILIIENDNIKINANYIYVSNDVLINFI